MRLLVCGSRTWEDPDPISALIVGYGVLSRRRSERFVVIHGGCRTGADAHAAWSAHRWGVEQIVVPAEWDRDGRRAGPDRNQRMLAEYPEVAWAFRNAGSSRGTDDMIDRARRAGVSTYVVSAATVEGDRSTLVRDSPKGVGR